MGSISQRRCLRLTSCDNNIANQSSFWYSLMIIAAISFLLFTIYMSSGRILTFRETRRAKLSEVAAKIVREKALARERWKVQKHSFEGDIVDFQEQPSHTFLTGQVASLAEHLNASSAIEIERGHVQISPAEQRNSENKSNQLSHLFSEKLLRSSRKVAHAIDESSVVCKAFPLETQNTNMINKIAKLNNICTESHIFKYTFALVEEERGQHLYDESIPVPATDLMHSFVRMRPPIELSFVDLTLTLKAKGRHILRCITGKITPGRVTAIMGPSGAGKTTLLSALAGREIGCTTTGSIFINGKRNSIHSYKKVIGYVPQDDILHGNLTVQENFWFSADCRLSADLPRNEKVLIVERVIESLGLQDVRGSLVGTVEKKKISGGQRKRVNVGLEMVVEPSILFLDEPTSGLDSSSSHLLLRALQHEAIEGANICMVVHQPSYTLFKMFDDLILLAKGGLPVYHGPVRDVEGYFAGLGIIVPDRVNPIDQYIDVLQGLVETSSGVSCMELPIRWMIHKGYPVPPDLQQIIPTISLSAPSGNKGSQDDSINAEKDEPAIPVEIWQDVMTSVEQRKNIIQHTFVRRKDLSNRKTSSILRQYRYFLGRVFKQRLREARLQAMDYLILLFAGGCLGSIAKMSDDTFGAPGYGYAIITISLLCIIAALRSFSLDKFQYNRERASGISSLAYFFSKDTIDLFNVTIKPAVFLSLFYFFSNPRSSFVENYIVFLCTVYCVTGIAYVLAIFLQPGPSQLCSVLLPVLFTQITIEGRRSKPLYYISSLCYPKWALEAFVIANAQRYNGVWLITRCGALYKFGYDIRHWGQCLYVLCLMGVASRTIAFLGMLAFRKK